MFEHSFNSFLMGGFECSTHRDNRGRRLDLIASTRHDEFAEMDYDRLLGMGIKTCRDGLRWHLIETEPYSYDFTSLASQVRAAKATGIEIIWDYFHYGYPDDIDIFSEAFLERFSAFSKAATEYLCDELGSRLTVCPVNEISFFSWIAGTAGIFYPCKRQKGNELKKQLVRAAVASARAIRLVCPSARMMFTDPAIHVVTNKTSPEATAAAEKYRLAQFDGFDMLTGRVLPELGGDESVIDLIGLNYYFHNQWFFANRRKIAPGHQLYRPLKSILAEFYTRYEKPLVIAETGNEDDDRPEWFTYVCRQTAAARASGTPIHGLCLYPIVNHPGWADDRHCHNGLWDYADDSGKREIFAPLAAKIRSELKTLQCRSSLDLQTSALAADVTTSRRRSTFR